MKLGTPRARHFLAHHVARCRVRDQTGQWLLCIVMELADPSAYGLAGASLWSCIEPCVEQNMEGVVYARLPNAKRTLPLLGGEPMIRWVFLQARHFHLQASMCVDNFGFIANESVVSATCL